MNSQFQFQFQNYGMWNVELFQFPFQNFGMWNVELFQFPFQNVGMWNAEYVFESVSFLTLLKCIGMWNVEWKSTFQFHSRILECGMELFFLRMSHSSPC